MCKPRESELCDLRNLLTDRTPPGPQYRELVNEIWSRGFEVFVVGGTIRDVLGGVVTRDVDLATTMPLLSAAPLLKSMYKRPERLHPVACRNGHLRLGGAVDTGDPFIDFCVFKHSLIGTSQALFGADFVLDVRYRDFTCNTVYFEPIAGVLIDPTGRGVQDAEDRVLDIVFDHQARPGVPMGKILIRFFKFLSRGFTPSPDCQAIIESSIISSLKAMGSSVRLQYIHAQILSKYPAALRAEQFELFHRSFQDFGAARQWQDFIEPLRGGLRL